MDVGPGGGLEAPLALPGRRRSSASGGVAPRWLRRLLRFLQALGIRPDRPWRFLQLLLAYVAGWGWMIWSVAQALGKHPQVQPPCEWRASLWLVLLGAAHVVDFVGMWLLLRVKGLPSFWQGASPHTMSLLGPILQENIASFAVLVLFYSVPIFFWMRESSPSDMRMYWASILGCSVSLFLHMALNSVSFDFQAVYMARLQDEFCEGLRSGSLDVAEAYAAHREVNRQRRTVFRFIELMLSIYSALCVLSMVVLCYDWVFMPWSHWSLIFFYCSLGSFFSFVAMRNWVKMNAWNDELLRQVAEATGGLGERELWTVADRTAFLSYLRATKHSLSIWETELDETFSVAMPSILFGIGFMFFELGEAHGWGGFSFDQRCGYGHHGHAGHAGPAH